MTDATELEDLESLVLSPGWKRVEALFTQQWGRSGERYCDVLERMCNTTDKVAAADEIQRVIWVRKELELFFRSIETRYHELKHRKAPATSGSRRGML